jgi:Rrf2 family protein
MKLISRDSDYAIRALCFIAKRKKNKISVTELVKELKIPKAFLRKILQIMDKKGLLKSYKGRGGGFVLAVSAAKLSLLDVIETFQGKLILNQCTFKKKPCTNIKTCKVKKKIDSIQSFVVSQLKSVKISSLLR